MYKNDKILFGPGGNSERFYEKGHKSTLEAPDYLVELGLNAYEYQSGHGVRVGEGSAIPLGKKAKELGIKISMHAPYYISLASAEMHKRDNSINYILQTAKAVSLMGGNRMVVHPGGIGKMSREEATVAATETLERSQKALDENGFSDISMCMETMGKINQLGNLDEVLYFCSIDERILPCIDFGHLYARTLGEWREKADFEMILDKVENKVGIDRAKNMHVHFSKIEYSKGGEKKHLTFEEESGFGPEPEPLMKVFANRNYTPTVICESSGTQDIDAVTLKKLFDKARGGANE